MKILHVILAYEPAVGYGGPVQSVRRLARGLAAAGHTCTVCTTNSDGHGIVAVPLDRPGRVDDSEVYYFDCPRWRYFGYSPAMRRWLRGHVHGYDIVHIHGVWHSPERYAAAAARRAGIPYVIAPRGMLDRLVVDTHFRWLKRIYLRWLDRANLAGAAGFHFTTEAERERCVYTPLPGQLAWVVPNPVERLAEGGAGLPPGLPDGPFLLFVGRLTWKKNVDLLVRAFARLAAAFPAMALVVAGPDDEGLLPGLRALAGGLGVGGRVRFIGTVPAAGLPALYRRAAALVLPSRSENFGNVVVEALLAGTPVVVSAQVDVAGVPAVRPLVTVSELDAEALALALRSTLAGRDAICARIAAAAGELEAVFSPAAVGQAMSGAYAAAAASVRRA